MTWVVMLLLTTGAFLTTRRLAVIPGTMQSVAEIVIEGIYNLFKSVVGNDYINKFFPLFATIFFFVIVANWAGLLPGVGTVGIKNSEVSREREAVEVSKTAAQDNESLEHEDAAISSTEGNSQETHSTFTPLLRGATADLNTTLAIALVSVASIQFYGLKTLGTAYLKKFFNFSNPIMFGVGLLEIVSEASRIISFAFRLFGNIFAGEVLLTVIAFLMPLIAPLPFLGLELFVGFIQALVFSMLTAVFLNMSVAKHEEH